MPLIAQYEGIYIYIVLQNSAQTTVFNYAIRQLICSKIMQYTLHRAEAHKR